MYSGLGHVVNPDAGFHAMLNKLSLTNLYKGEYVLFENSY